MELDEQGVDLVMRATRILLDCCFPKRLRGARSLQGKRRYPEHGDSFLFPDPNQVLVFPEHNHGCGLSPDHEPCNEVVPPSHLVSHDLASGGVGLVLLHEHDDGLSPDHGPEHGVVRSIKEGPSSLTI